MALRPRLQPILETVQEFELAAEERYWAGLELMTRGDALTGIYILGYVAEMLLKNSYFLLSVATRPTFPVGSQLAQDKLAMSILVPQYKFKSYHDLTYWAIVLAEKRRNENRPLPLSLETELMAHVQRLSENWFVELRYRAGQALPTEIAETYESVTWIRTHYLDGTLYSPRR